ncbi:MAG: DUF2971 domain-containing protein [Thermoanaerobaculia bacterium]
MLGRTFTATRFVGPEGEDLYDWVADHRTAAFSLGRLVRRAVAELNGEPAKGEDAFLYHYTSWAAFESIGASDEIWISDYRALNDETELLFGRRMAARSFARYDESPAFSELLRECLAASLDDAFYVASFSLHGDCLNQWRAYGDGCKGVAAAFDIPEFSQLTKNDPRAVTFSRVTYDEEKQALLFSLIATVAQQIVAIDTQRNKLEINILVRELQGTISELLPLCKNPAFEDERECRLVVVPCLTLSGLTGDLRVRRRRGLHGDVGYLTTKDIAPNFELPLRALVAGPWAEASTLASMRKYADDHALPVRESSVPLRRPPQGTFASA